MSETKIFNTNAAGRMVAGVKAKSTIKARYPLAPPCPTEAYKNAIIRSEK